MRRKYVFRSQRMENSETCGRGRGLPPCGEGMGKGRGMGRGLGRNMGGCEIGGPGYGRGQDQGMGRNRSD